MLRKIGLPAVVLAIVAGVGWSQTGGTSSPTSPDDRREAEQFTYLMQNRAQTMRTLAGHEVVLRVYPNPYANPEKYVRVTLPVNDSSIQLAAIRATVPAATSLSQVLLQAADQTDDAVAKAIEGCVALTTYREGEWPIQSYHHGGRIYEPYWTFLDAQGKPMAGASVETRIVLGWLRFDSPSLVLGRATLDDKGRLKRLLCVGGTSVFTVQHRNYGVASVFVRTVSGDPSGICIVPMVPRIPRPPPSRFGGPSSTSTADQ